MSLSFLNEQYDCPLQYQFPRPNRDSEVSKLHLTVRSTVTLPNFKELQLAMRVLAGGGKNQRVGGESASVVAQQMKD